MPYEATSQIFDDYIRLEVTGERVPGRELEDATAIGKEFYKIPEELGIKKVLLVLRMTGRLSPIAAYEIFSDPKEYGWFRDIKLALVDMNEESREDSKFSETVAVNRAYNMSVFDNEEEALQWLLETPKPRF